MLCHHGGVCPLISGGQIVNIKLQEHLEASGQLLDDHHQTHQDGQQVGDTEGGGGHDGYGDGEGAGGGREEHGVEFKLICTKSSTPLQLVRRKYRLKDGIKRDGMLQPKGVKG